MGLYDISINQKIDLTFTSWFPFSFLLYYGPLLLLISLRVGQIQYCIDNSRNGICRVTPLFSSLFPSSELMRDRDVGKVRIDSFYNLIVVVRKFLELEIKVVQTGDELHFRGVAANDNELLGEDAFDDKTAAVMLQSGFTKQLVEADILLFIEAKRILVTRSFGLLCSFLVSIHSFGLERRSTRENAPASQSEHLCRTKRSLSDKGTARYPLARVRIRAGELLPKVSEVLHDGA